MSVQKTKRTAHIEGWTNGEPSIVKLTRLEAETLEDSGKGIKIAIAFADYCVNFLARQCDTV